MFVGKLSQVIDETVEDPATREELYRNIQEAFSEQTAPEYDPESQLPRGRDHNSGEASTEQDGETS